MMTSERLPRVDSGHPKRYRFLFELANGVAFGGDFTLSAQDERAAFDTLEQIIPGASTHVKLVQVIH